MKYNNENANANQELYLKWMKWSNFRRQYYSMTMYVSLLYLAIVLVVHTIEAVQIVVGMQLFTFGIYCFLYYKSRKLRIAVQRLQDRGRNV